MTKRKLTKMMTAAFLAAGATLPMTVQAAEGSQAIFQDVMLDDPYATAIHYLAERGVIAGSGGYFYPTKAITVADALTMLERYLYEAHVGSSTNDEETTLTYEEGLLLLTDFIYTATGINSVTVMQASTESFTQYGEPYRQAVATLQALNIPLAQDGAGEQSMPRGQFAFLLYHVIQQVVEADVLQNKLQLDDFLLEQMVFAKNGLEAFGTGAVPGTTISIRNAHNDVIGTGFVQRDGSYQIPLFPAVMDGERMALQVKDEANNRSTIEKTVQFIDQVEIEPIVMDFILESNKESPLATSLERFLHVASSLPIEDASFLRTLQQARQTLADWQASTDELLQQLDKIVVQLSSVLPGEAKEQVYQLLFSELQQIVKNMPADTYSKASWHQVERQLVQVDEQAVVELDAVQQAYYALGGLVTTFEEEQLTMQGGFYDLQEMMLAVEALLVPTSTTGDDIPVGEQWTTAEEKELLQQAVTHAMDVYIQMDPSISDILQAQSQLDLAIIRYEESKQKGRFMSGEVQEYKKALQQQVNELQLVAVSKDGTDVYTNAQWTPMDVRASLDKVIQQVRKAVVDEDITVRQLIQLRERLDGELAYYSKAMQFGFSETKNDVMQKVQVVMQEAQQLLETVKGANGSQEVDATMLWVPKKRLATLKQEFHNMQDLVKQSTSRQKMQKTYEQLQQAIAYVDEEKKYGGLSTRFAQNYEVTEAEGATAQLEEMALHVTVTSLREASVDYYEKK